MSETQTAGRLRKRACDVIASFLDAVETLNGEEDDEAQQDFEAKHERAAAAVETIRMLDAPMPEVEEIITLETERFKLAKDLSALDKKLAAARDAAVKKMRT